LLRNGWFLIYLDVITYINELDVIYMRTFILLFFVSSALYSQDKRDIFYFSTTGDTIIVPTFSIGDSTILSIYKFTDTKTIELKKITVLGFDNYYIPQSVLTNYNLKVKGQRAPNDKENVFINQKVISNKQIGFAIDSSKYLFRTKINNKISYKNNVVIKNYSTENDYDAKEKKDFSKETFFEPLIVKMDNHDIYFVSLSPRVYHPDMGIRIWSLLVEPDYLHYFGRQIK
jgi:hypothetical protein